MNIAIIPARSKSKIIKNKNLKLSNGKPIIYWAINLLLKSKIFDKVIVSTDSKKQKNFIKIWGRSSIFKTKKYSGDFSTTEK